MKQIHLSQQSYNNSLSALMAGVICVTAGFAQSIPPTVYLNVDASELSNMNVAFVARDRISRAGSVDQMFFLGTNPAGYPANDIIGYSGGFVGSSTYNFTLSYTANDSTYRFGLTDGVVSGNAFFRGNGANSTITYDASAHNLAYNIFHIYGVASSPGSSLSFDNLVFVPGAGLISSGIVEASGMASAAGTPIYDQWFAAPTGVNLADFDWSISANVQLNTTTNPNSGEGIKFEISTKNGVFTPQSSINPVPEPVSSLLVTFGVLLVSLTRRREH